MQENGCTIAFIKNTQPFQAAQNRLTEDEKIGFVLNEIATSGYDTIALARAHEEAEGNKEKTEALYIRHRVRRLNDSATQDAFLSQIIATDDLNLLQAY